MGSRYEKSKIALTIVVIIGCALLPLILNLARKEPSSPATKADTSRNHESKQPGASYGLPVRLKIPRLQIDAAIDQMGVTPDGDMQEPNNPQNTGWFKFGPHPGNKGSAVIAGHYGVNNDNVSVFNTLHLLNKGDSVQVVDEKGTIITFVVREFKTYDKNAIVPEVFSSNDEKAHLNLITCKGAWQATQQTYSDRLVVFTDKK